jgi:hypothetical protein
MTSKEIARCRLGNQFITGSTCRSPGEAVAAMGAVQAQDYLSSLWAIGLRVPNASEITVEQAIADRQIVRTWPLRGTLHFVDPKDVRWMLEHLGPRIVAAAARRHRDLELDDAVFTRSSKILIRALEGGNVLTRPEMMDLLERSKIATANQRGYHILWKLALGGLLCCGPRNGKQQTFVLLDEWLPPTRSRQSKDEALANFALRYFTSHGPATLEDFTWWIGMKKSDAEAVLNSIASHLSNFRCENKTYWINPLLQSYHDAPASLHLLPSFDEILIGYTDRTDALPVLYTQKITPGGNGIFMPIIIKGGRVIGTWSRAFTKSGVSVIHEAFMTLGKAGLREWVSSTKRYAEFLGVPIDYSLNNNGAKSARYRRQTGQL